MTGRSATSRTASTWRSDGSCASDSGTALTTDRRLVLQFPNLHIIHSWPAVLVEVLVVVLIGAIRRPPGWSQQFLKAFLLGIPAYAWAGLGLWAFMLPWAILCHAYAPRPAGEVAEFIANHPLLGLTVGPILALAFLVAGEYRTGRPSR